MKKFSVLVIALIGLLAFGGVAANAGKNNKTQKVNSTISLQYDQGPYDEYDPYGPYDEAVFKGKVKAQDAGRKARRKCQKRRTVIIKQVGGGQDGSSFTTRTNKRGRYNVAADSAYMEPGEYRARATKKRKIRAKIKCEPARSNTVTVP